MTKAHPHRQVNVHLDTVDDADIIERIEAQPSMVGYVRELVRRDIHDERLDYVALKESGLQAENAKLREHIASFKELSQDMVIYAGQNMKRHFAKRLRKLGVPL